MRWRSMIQADEISDAREEDLSIMKWDCTIRSSLQFCLVVHEKVC